MNTYSILVVDDEPDNFEVIEALLASMNYTLHYASHGQEALASIDKFDPDLILLDVMMPGIDGIEVCKQIKAISEWQAVPIVMVTALSSPTDLARCLAAGADDFISKPVNGVELRARVQSMLRIKKQHDRIEALSKLQRNNINSLKNNLNELNSDLSIRQSTSNSKVSIEQFAARKIDQFKSSAKLIFDIEDTKLAVEPKHLQYIISELLDYALNSPESSDTIHVHGHVKNEEFHFYFNSQKASSTYNYNIQALESIQFKPASNSEHELSTGLKIAKKIVEIHDGLFLIANTDRTETTIYLTLPLIRTVVSPKPLVGVAVNHLGSISDELQKNIYLS